MPSRPPKPPPPVPIGETRLGTPAGDRLLVAVVNRDVTGEVRSEGLITAEAGEPVAYLISARAYAELNRPRRPR